MVTIKKILVIIVIIIIIIIIIIICNYKKDCDKINLVVI